MKTFTYTARNQQGEVVTGTIETANFQHATESVRAKGFELISLEEVQQQVEELRTFVADALDEEGHESQVVIKGSDQETVEEVLEGELHYEVNQLHELSSEEEQKPSVKKKESIIFSAAAKHSAPRSVLPLHKLERAKKDLQDVLQRPALSSELKGDVDHLLQKLSLVREHQNKKHWKEIRKEIQFKLKQVKRDLERSEEKAWREIKNGSGQVEGAISYTEFSEDIKQERREVNLQVKEKKRKKKLTSAFMKNLQVLSNPNPHDEKELLMKQHYESLWAELDRFMGALMVFYLLFFFAGYYLKRSGVQESLLVNIYNATLFKQITLGLFLFSAFIGIRNQFLPKRVQSDGVVISGWILSMWILIF